MLTDVRTIAIDFSVDGQQQLLGGDQGRVWIQFTNSSLSQVGVDFVQQINIFDCAFVVMPLDRLVLTKGDLGSIIGNAFYGTTGPPTPVDFLVTVVFRI